jgi:hypothetical protein
MTPQRFSSFCSRVAHDVVPKRIVSAAAPEKRNTTSEEQPLDEIPEDRRIVVDVGLLVLLRIAADPRLGNSPLARHGLEPHRIRAVSRPATMKMKPVAFEDDEPLVLRLFGDESLSEPGPLRGIEAPRKGHSCPGCGHVLRPPALSRRAFAWRARRRFSSEDAVRIDERRVRLGPGENEPDEFDARPGLTDSPVQDARRFVHRVAVHTRRDGRSPSTNSMTIIAAQSLAYIDTGEHQERSCGRRSKLGRPDL